MRAGLYAAGEPLRALIPEAVWTPVDRLHLTVKFLGDTPESAIGALQDALGKVAGNHEDVPLVLRGGGVFPSRRRPRVVWAGVEPSPRLELLHHDVEEACARLGFPVEGRPFRPHVTLGRLKARLEPSRARALVGAVERLAFVDEGAVSSLDLMQSTLTRHGPSYRCLMSASLRAV